MLLPEPQEIKNYIQKDKTYLGFGNLIVKDNLSSKLGMYTGIKFLENYQYGKRTVTGQEMAKDEV